MISLLTWIGDITPAFPVVKVAGARTGARTGCTDMAVKYCGGSRNAGESIVCGPLECVSIGVEVVAII